MVDKFQKLTTKIKSKLNKHAIETDRDIREKVVREKSRYAKELADIENKNIKKMESTKAAYIKEKDDALARADEEFRNSIEGLREKLNKKYFLKESSWKNQINENNYENGRTIEFYEKQLSELKDVAAKEFKRITKLAEGRRVMERKEFIRNIRERNREFQNKVDNLKKNFDRKLPLIN